MKNNFLFKQVLRLAFVYMFCVFLFAHANSTGNKNNASRNAQQVFYADADVDGYGNPLNSVKAKEAPKGYVANNSDCNDKNVTIHPGAPELCDGKDNNCNGIIDEDCGAPDITGRKKCHCDEPQDYYADADGDGYGNEADVITACEAPEGYTDVAGDCDDGNAEVYPDAAEFCDGIDNDCDGLVDAEDPDCLDVYLFYADKDGDGFGDYEHAIRACVQPDGYVDDNSDCDDGNPEVNPDAAEFCDGIDNDCDELVDADDPDVFYAYVFFADYDGDGYGDPDDAVFSCNPEPPDGYVDNYDDCDDNHSTVNPGAAEFCDGIDNDCDGLIDGEDPDLISEYVYFADNDGDGYGDRDNAKFTCDPEAPDGYVENKDDCDDTDPFINPGAKEVCDGIDNNCDKQIDEGVKLTFYRDADGDGYGNPSISLQACTPPLGYVADNTDCRDNNKYIHPGAEEICDRIDNNCNGQVDEETPPPIISSPNLDLCDGPVSLSVFNPVAGLNYQWFKVGKGAIPGATGTTYSATRKGTYWVLAYLNQLCRKVSNTQTVFNSCGGSAISSNEISSSASSIINDDLSLYPNPTKGTIRISYKSDKPGKIQLKVYDITGRTVSTSTEQAIKGSNIFKLTLGNLVSGIYYMELINGTEQSRVKFVIEK